MTEINLLSDQSTRNQRALTSKIIILWILGIAVAFAFGWFLKSFFDLVSLNTLIWTSLAAFVFLIIYLIQVIFVSNSRALAMIVFLQSIAMVASFAMKSLSILSFSVVIFLILLWGNSSGRNVLENQLKIRFSGVGTAVLPKGVMAVALFIAAIAPVYLKTSGLEFPFSPFLFQEVVYSGSFLTNKFLPGFTSTSTVEEIVIKTSEQKLESVPGSEKLPQSAKQQLIKQSVVAFYNQISAMAGVEINPKLNIPDSLYQIAKVKFSGLSEQNKNIVFAGIGVAIFLTIGTLSWPLRMLVSFLAFIIYEIMLASKFGRIELESRSKEIIIL